MTYDKSEWIAFFTQKANEKKKEICARYKSQNERASRINKYISNMRDESIQWIKSNCKDLSQIELLNEILTITYASYIVMLELRNSVWHYDYMAFSRRIGEMWEPFCKLSFEYSINPLKIIDPPVFQDVQTEKMNDAIEYINNLDVSDEIKQELKNYYAIPWTMVDSGGISLALDLHFEQDGIHYNCDFKSGFNSNEKGNTNRLLLVASIYNTIGEIERTLLFVRQDEDDNNHYLQTLKNSPYWEVYCAKDCYAAMERFTGFNMREWIDENIDWKEDISPEFREHLERNNLLKYLTW